MTKMTDDELIAVLRSLERKGNDRELYRRRRRGLLAHHRKGHRRWRWRGGLAGRQPIRIGLVAMSTCPQCDQPGIFGYRDENGEMTWYCTTHRLGQDWADARRDQTIPVLQARFATPSTNR